MHITEGFVLVDPPLGDFEAVAFGCFFGGKRLVRFEGTENDGSFPDYAKLRPESVRVKPTPGAD